MKRGEIILLKLTNEKIIPAVILGKKSERIIGLQVKSYRELKEQDIIKNKRPFKDYKKELRKIRDKIDKVTVFIGKPDGLKYESVIKVNKEFVFNSSNIIKIISKIDEDMLIQVMSKYKAYNRIQSLHKELHILKKKILLCQINNENYNNYQERVYKILEELGLPISGGSPGSEAYGRFREVPTNGYIKVYKGGR